MDLIAFTLITVLGFFLGREVPADRVILLPDADGKVGAVFVKTRQGEQLLNTAYGSVSVSAQGAIAAGNEEAKVTRERYAPALVALPARPVSFTVFFVSGSDTQLSAESVPVIQQMKDALAARPAPEITLIGHTDTVGSHESNDALALRRASNVRDILVGSGLQAASLTVAGRGERELLVPTQDNVPEEKNRRVEINIR